MGCILALLSLFVGDAFLLFGFKDDTVKQIKTIIAVVLLLILLALYLVKFSHSIARSVSEAWQTVAARFG
jgi:hypothetical protein